MTYSATKASLSLCEKPRSLGSRRVARFENQYSVGARLSAKVISQFTRRGLLFEGMGKLARKTIDRGHDDARVVSQVFVRRASVCGGPPAVWLKLARGGSVTNHVNGEIGKSAMEKMSNQPPLDCMHRTSFCREEKPLEKEMRWGKRKI
eukprot:6212451-Pleurochrysis_carterae.AAC.10